MGLDAEAISEEVEAMWKTMYKLTKTFMDQVWGIETSQR